MPLIVLGLCFFLYLWMIAPRFSGRKHLAFFRNTKYSHRGLHTMKVFAPENSLAAFRRAIRRGYGIEMDLQLTKDGEVVVFHDDDLFRMTNHGGRVSDLTLEELKELSLHGTAEKIPTLRETLELVSGRVPLLLELKLNSRDHSLMEAVSSLLSDYSGHYIIESFNTEVLHWFRRHHPKVLRGQLSANLLKKGEGRDYRFLRWMTKHLLLNFYGRPDFISYDYRDHTISSFFLRHLFRTPFLAWTVKNEKDYYSKKRGYQSIIFEDFEP